MCGWWSVETMMDRRTPGGFVRNELAGPKPPPRTTEGTGAWVRARLLNGPLNSVLTVLSLALIAALVWPSLKFLLIDAVWRGTDRNDCLPETVGHEVGACWPFIAAKLNQFMYGFYPRDQQWRVNLTYGLAAVLLAPLLVPRVPFKALNAVAFLGA